MCSGWLIVDEGCEQLVEAGGGADGACAAVPLDEGRAVIIECHYRRPSTVIHVGIPYRKTERGEA